MENEYKVVISDKKTESQKLMTEEQLASCNFAIHSASAAAGVEGAIPILGVDAVPISATQIAMVFALGKIFEQELTYSAAKAILGAAASTFVGRNLVKLIPIAGWIVSATIAAGVTEAIGWTIAVDFAKSYQKNLRNDSADQGIEEEQENSEIEDDPDDESMSNDFSRALGEEEN